MLRAPGAGWDGSILGRGSGQVPAETGRFWGAFGLSERIEPWQRKTRGEVARTFDTAQAKADVDNAVRVRPRCLDLISRSTLH